ncbi:ribosomal protection-like ABC-F family protein [Fusibacter ferrireducens]|uniref:ABC-F family ATP-binding cassette domain-containing protein n=1 Tax=Fusibacter ferrireducens TaxID=2785058 RepID=A0ABR9ZPF6_9FIRM|nr:ABC-F family ATP-binding cassette domain-containing protein [Fusibacter ferrireducens]MBF4691815.1 ABC-F family ATP-binding cassette domain-containing protein [Fusibacter ferrireducens]
MTILTCKNLNKAYGYKSVLEAINIELFYGERVGIVGENGAGKTTLIQLISGKLKADSGTVEWHDRGVTVGLLTQSSTYEFLNIDVPELNSTYFEIESKLKIDLVSEKEMSGGERTKVALAKIWATEPNVLILDEPTNHLDYNGIDWLINEVHYFPGTVIVISHDRYFLDQICTKIIEIENGTSTSYEGNYSQYVSLKSDHIKAQRNAYAVQESYKKQIQADIRQLKTWSDKAHRDATKKQRNGMGKKEHFRAKAKKKDKQIKSRIKRLEKIEIEGIEKPRADREIVMHFKDAGARGKNIIEAKNISKSFGDKILFKPSDFYMTRGERIGILGNNGCGKTTLVRLIMKQLTLDSGELLMSPALKIAYMDQYAIDTSPEETIQSYFDLYDRAALVDLSNKLYQLGFKSLDLNHKVTSCSFGEQTKLKLLKLLLGTYDLLILDEPTNHMDLKSKETFETALAQYNGTILLITHDRYLMEKICNGYLVFEADQILRREIRLAD